MEEISLAPLAWDIDFKLNPGHGIDLYFPLRKTERSKRHAPEKIISTRVGLTVQERSSLHHADCVIMYIMKYKIYYTPTSNL
jgi:hypothetical protein